MNCRRFRELAQQGIVESGDAALGLRVANAAEELGKQDVGVQQHAAECAHCRLFWSGLLGQIEVLNGLARRSAPDTLAGRVVAAVHAGYREDRAVARVASLPALGAPPALARRMEHEFRVKAPAVLDRLVERRLSDPREARRRRSRRASRARVLGAAAVLGFALWITLPGTGGLGGPGVDPAFDGLDAGAAGMTYDFEIVRVGSLEEVRLDPDAREWVEGITGSVSRE